MATPDLPIWLLPLASATAAMRQMTNESEAALRYFANGAAVADVDLPWATENRVAFDLPTMQLRAFDDRARGAPIVIAAPFAIHDATIVDLAPGHSLVQLLCHATGRPVYVTHWKSATPATAAFSIDAYLADLNAAVDLTGGGDLVGVCQGGWMALLFAATFPAKVRRLVLAGAPVDVERADSMIATAARMTPRPWIDALMASHGGLAPTGEIFAQLIAQCATPAAARTALQIEEPETIEDADALTRYLDWNRRPMALPGVYFLQTLDWLFRENRLARGEFPAFGQPADTRRVKAPVYVLAGDRDDFTPAAQALAALDIVGTQHDKRSRVVRDCGHLDLFLGKRTQREEWPRVVQFLESA